MITGGSGPPILRNTHISFYEVQMTTINSHQPNLVNDYFFRQPSFTVTTDINQPFFININSYRIFDRY